jgi:hypothetical protein
MDIRDQTQMKDSRQGFGFGAPDNQGAPGPQNGTQTNPPSASTSDFSGEIQ